MRHWHTHEDEFVYPEVDLLWSPPHARGRFTRRDGTDC